MSLYLLGAFLLAAVPVPTFEDAATPIQTYDRMLGRHTYPSSLPCLDGTLPYCLYSPPNANSKQSYPLILWLHGEGESGRNNRSQLNYVDDMLAASEVHGGLNFYLLVPQKPSSVPWAVSSTLSHSVPTQPHDVLAVVEELLDSTIELHPIDKNRVSILGISSGGAAAWELAARRPALVSAIVPCGSNVPPSVDLRRLLEVPVWAFHSAIDERVSFQSAQEAVRKLKREGGTAAFTFASDFPGVSNSSKTHYCWLSAFREYQTLPWMIDQHRGQKRMIPGKPLTTQAWQNWAILTIVSSLGGLLGYFLFKKLRRRSTSISHSRSADTTLR